uniref:Excisionase n=1 Tax=Ascaris lumbricoides TaxID=6252 RepID=A0A0M3HF73_ASCLU
MSPHSTVPTLSNAYLIYTHEAAFRTVRWETLRRKHSQMLEGEWIAGGKRGRKVLFNEKSLGNI